MEMTYERAMELLNSIIDYTAVAKNTNEQLNELFHMGFTENELENVFHYSRTDIENYLFDEK